MKFLVMLLLPLHLFGQNSSILFNNVNIIDVENGKVLSNQNVLIKGNRIKAISSKTIQSKVATVINGKGKYLIPGLCDFNAEILNYENENVPGFLLMLANGVTSVRDLQPDQGLAEIFAIKNKIAKGEVPAPRLYLSGKTLIDRPPFQQEDENRSYLVSSVAEAIKAVDLMLENGADVIDIRTILNNDILQAITQRAHAKGKKVLARYSGSWEEGSNLGIDAYTHISDLWRTASKGRTAYFTFSKGDSMRFVSGPEFYNRVLQSLGTVDTPYFHSLVNTLVKNNTWLCFSAASFKPSLVRFEIGDSSRAQFRTKKQQMQQAEFLKLNDQITFAQAKASKPAISYVLLAAKEGVHMIAGTQLEEFTTPGVSLHDMLYWMVDGGLSPAEALQTATINPARFLNKQNDLGTIKVEKLADLVLLDANPLDDINNTRKIDAVVANGRLFQRKDLNKLLLLARERAKKLN